MLILCFTYSKFHDCLSSLCSAATFLKEAVHPWSPSHRVSSFWDNGKPGFGTVGTPCVVDSARRCATIRLAHQVIPKPPPVVMASPGRRDFVRHGDKASTGAQHGGTEWVLTWLGGSRGQLKWQFSVALLVALEAFARIHVLASNFSYLVRGD